MAKYQKPNSVNTIWAIDALSEDINKPSDNYIQAGWTQVKPPYEYENWSMNKLHQGLAYFNQLGIPEWDSNTEYQAFKSYVQGNDDRIYRCIQTHTDRNPTSGNSSYWETFEGNRAATTSRRGTVELATNTETEAGDRSDLAITPASLQNKTASSSKLGILRFATTSEVSDGSRSDVAISPATLQFRSATTSQSGLVELATSAEAQEGTRNDRALTPESITGLFRVLFPVGSIIMRPTDPGKTISEGGLGFGTWEKISGRSIIGEGSYTDSNSQNRSFVAGDSEGTFRHRLSTQEMPSHNHNATSSEAGDHDHSGTTSNAGVHNHSATTSEAGRHRHGAPSDNDSGAGGGSTFKSDDQGRVRTNYVDYAGEHTHSVSVNNAGNHNHSFTTNNAGNHNHTINVESRGGNDYHNNLHPVFVAAIWHRTA